MATLQERLIRAGLLELMRDVQSNVVDDGLDTMVEVVDILASEIVLNTPRRTGRARGSWYLSLAGLRLNEPTLDYNGGHTVARIKIAARNLRDQLSGMNQGLSLTLDRPALVGLALNRFSDLDLEFTTNVRYMLYLELGHSPQARGFIANAINKVNARFPDIR